MRFIKAGAALGGLTFLGFPSLLNWRVWETFAQVSAFLHLGSSTETRDIVVHDARASTTHDYGRTGFALRPLVSSVGDWAKAALRGTDEQAQYREELTALLRELHPGLKRAEFQ